MPQETKSTERFSRSLSRREMMALAGMHAVGLTLAGAWPKPARALAQKNDNGLAPYNRWPRMVHEYFVDQVRRATAISRARKETVDSEEQAAAYVKDVRQRIQQSFGPWPEKTPLKPRITGTVERDEYRIEKVLFESRPGFLVTGNLYLPKGREFPAPGVVGTCGHSTNGKAAEAYQSYAQGLARMGYVCLIYDPIGQGERLQYVDENLDSTVGVGVREHLYAGNQQFLVGEFIGSWRAWDGIRALDYLLTREEVDPQHLGVTGNSGGGTMTTWLCGVERRWTMAAPSCFVTSFRRNMENELPADTEQCPPKALALGLDHEDFLAAMAPEPVIILAKEKDYFDVRGTKAAHDRLEELYDEFDAEDNVALFVGPTYHGYSQENREAMYGFFNAVTQVSDRRKEPEITIEDDATLWCAPNGQIAELDSRTVFSFTKEKSQMLAGQRESLRGDALREAVAGTLRLSDALKSPDFSTGKKPPGYRIIRNRQSRNYPKPHAITYAVNTEPGIHAICYRLADERMYSRPPRTGRRAVLYVSHLSSDAELRNEPLICDLLKDEPDAAFFTCDVRGIGDSQPDTCGPDSFHKAYGSDYFYAIHAIMLDRPYPGMRTWDLLRVLDWLANIGHTDVHLVAKGWGTIPATFAALLSQQVKQVTLKHNLTSYAEIAEAEKYGWPLSSFVPDVLQTFDLPDCYAELQPKKLRQIEPWGPAVDTHAVG